MNIDKSYLSRIIKKHENKGYVIKLVSETDSRAYQLHLTEEGMERTKDFIQKSNREIENIITHLHEDEYTKLIEALNTVTEILGNHS